MKLRELIPFLEWIPHYNRRDFRGDLLAGLTVGVMLVPQGMAYGLLAGLPPIYGLYASIFPLMLYAFFGTSRQLSVGPVALVSLLILTGVGQFAEPGSQLFISMAITTALIAGVIQVLLGGLRLGFLINFLSHPVISGFTSAAAFIIGLSQVKNLLGVEIPQSNRIHEVVGGIIEHAGEINFPTFFIGVGAIAFILILRRINRAIPGALITLILSILLVWLTGVYEMGVTIVGEVPKGLPAFGAPVINAERIQQLFPLALTICLISFIESLAIAKTIEAKHKSYRVIPNQELLALGLTKIGGAFFQSYPTTGSFTRSAVNNEAGARTGVSSIISSLIIGLTLLFLTPLFFYLPKALLASIVVVAVLGLIDYKEAIHLWRHDRRDFLILMVTFVATLTLGIQDGVLFGVLLSIALMLYRNSKPNVAILGRLPGTDAFRNVKRFPEGETDPEVLIVRFDNQLYFGNAGYFRDKVEDLVAEKGDQLKVFILDASSIHDIDSSGIHSLHEVIQFLQTRNIELYLSGVIGPVRDILYKNRLMEQIGSHNQYLKIVHALEAYKKGGPKESGSWASEAVQTNISKPPSAFRK